jgi:thiol-disulfide isomerase/thioredoxin
MFICNHCPYVVHVRETLAKIGEDYVPKGIGIVAISSNDANNYPDDAPKKLKTMAESLKFNFPFCYDDTQDVAKAYRAVCTPDFFLFDKEQQLVYRGQLDDSRPGNNKPVDGASLRSAIGAVLTGQAVAVKQKPSVGCSIKWKPGNSPGG